jgi:PAS domain S-box-containing protein
VLSALTSNVSLNTARTIADAADQNINDLVVIEVALGIAGLVVSLLLAWGLMTMTRRQGAHFRKLVQSSSDLVMVLSPGGCRYASPSMTRMVGQPESELLGRGFERFVHGDDRPLLAEAAREGEPRALTFRVRNRAGDWRHLEALLTDLRGDRQVRWSTRATRPSGSSSSESSASRRSGTASRVSSGRRWRWPTTKATPTKWSSGR